MVSYDLNHKNCDTAWEYVKNKGYKFCAATEETRTSAYNTSTFCNAYVYLGASNLENLMAID